MLNCVEMGLCEQVYEKRKIKCGKANFDEFEGVEYRQVAKVSDLD